jgi:hypothetical protein
MSLLKFFPDLPAWSAFVLTLFWILGAFELGYRFGAVRHRSASDEKPGPVGQLGVATLGMLGFFLAFAFGLAANRYEGKRQLVIDEANAIGTTYLRADFLEEPARGKARQLLREYVETRLAPLRGGDLVQAIARSEALQAELWALVVANTAGAQATPRTGLLIASLNETIDLHGKRLIAGVHSRIPVPIFVVLDLMTVLAMVSIGYHAALSETRRSPAIVPLALTLAVVMWLIAELDRGHEGLLMVSQQPLVEALRGMGEPSQP